MNVYLDNAASTSLDSEVVEVIKQYMLNPYGNPSSIHCHGRKVRATIELGRKKIAEILHCNPGEIIFTSGGTESDNTILINSIKTYHIKHVISSAIEHPAVSYTLDVLKKENVIELHLVDLDNKGNIDYTHLERLLKAHPNALVSLMHANNEIGNLLDMEQVADLCCRYSAYFHSDTVQSIGHYRYDLKSLDIHGMAASAHKFHGPKGVGFMYLNENKKILPYIHGGSQERNMRGGTENVLGIVGMVKAMEIAYHNLEKHEKHIKGIKSYMIEQLRNTIPNIIFNGNSGDIENSLYTILNIKLPCSEDNNTLLFSLDMEGICVSGGSACSSGSLTGSRVLNAISSEPRQEGIRFSFSKNTQFEEIDYTVEKLHALCVEHA